MSIRVVFLTLSQKHELILKKKLNLCSITYTHCLSFFYIFLVQSERSIKRLTWS